MIELIKHPGNDQSFSEENLGKRFDAFVKYVTIKTTEHSKYMISMFFTFMIAGQITNGFVISDVDKIVKDFERRISSHNYLFIMETPSNLSIRNKEHEFSTTYPAYDDMTSTDQENFKLHTYKIPVSVPNNQVKKIHKNQVTMYSIDYVHVVMYHANSAYSDDTLEIFKALLEICKNNYNKFIIFADTNCTNKKYKDVDTSFDVKNGDALKIFIDATVKKYQPPQGQQPLVVFRGSKKIKKIRPSYGFINDQAFKIDPAIEKDGMLIVTNIPDDFKLLTEANDNELYMMEEHTM